MGTTYALVDVEGLGHRLRVTQVISIREQATIRRVSEPLTMRSKVERRTTELGTSCPTTEVEHRSQSSLSRYARGAFEVRVRGRVV
jgi:hypothetical protein